MWLFSVPMWYGSSSKVFLTNPSSSWWLLIVVQYLWCRMLSYAAQYATWLPLYRWHTPRLMFKQLPTKIAIILNIASSSPACFNCLIVVKRTNFTYLVSDNWNNSRILFLCTTQLLYVLKWTRSLELSPWTRIITERHTTPDRHGEGGPVWWQISKKLQKDESRCKWATFYHTRQGLTL